jgi:hypothetical protein
MVKEVPIMPYDPSSVIKSYERNAESEDEAEKKPTFADTIDSSLYCDPGEWEKLKRLELEICTRPELLGVGLHLLFVAKKK